AREERVETRPARPRPGVTAEPERIVVGPDEHIHAAAGVDRGGDVGIDDSPEPRPAAPATLAELVDVPPSDDVALADEQPAGRGPHAGVGHGASAETGPRAEGAADGLQIADVTPGPAHEQVEAGAVGDGDRVAGDRAGARADPV